jgi:hypothetical protein
MATTKPTAKTKAPAKKTVVAKPQKVQAGETVELETVEVAEVAEETPVQEQILLTEEALKMQEDSLKEGIERALEWFEFGQDEESYKGMTEKEQTFTRLLDPMIWIMRESLITYEHEDCEDCKVRRESNGNSLAVAISEMILGKM